MSDTGIPARYADGRNEGRSDMARASAARPFKPYVYKGGDIEPPDAIAARERWQALKAERERIRAELDARTLVMPDIGPGPEWHRERSAEDEDDLRGLAPAASAPPPPPLAPPLALSLVPDEDELAELEAARDRYQSAQDTLNAQPEPPPPGYGGQPVPPVRLPDERCRAQGGL